MLLRTVILAISIAIAVPGWAQQPQLPLFDLSAGMHRIEAEVAATPESRQTGMMLRTSMPSHRGMLFVFPEVAKLCMWMRNSPVRYALEMNLGWFRSRGLGPGFAITGVDKVPAGR